MKYRSITRSLFTPAALPRVTVGAVLAATLGVIGFTSSTAHAHTQTRSSFEAADLKRLPGETATAAQLQTLQLFAERKHDADKQRASRARRAKLELERPKWVLPVDSAVSSPYGYRWGRFHSGIDFVANIGTPVHAAGDGVVINPTDGTAGYGNVLCIAHSDGSVTWYAHLSVKQVSIGQHVEAGQVIALSGATGQVTGPHVHFEVRFNNVPVNPIPWLRGHGVLI